MAQERVKAELEGRKGERSEKGWQIDNGCSLRLPLFIVGVPGGDEV